MFVWRTKADYGFAANQSWLIILGHSLIDGGRDGGAAVAVDVCNNVPTVGLESLCGIVGEPAAYFTVDRNIVVIVECDKLAEFQSTCQRTGLVRDAFH